MSSFEQVDLTDGARASSPSPSPPSASPGATSVSDAPPPTVPTLSSDAGSPLAPRPVPPHPPPAAEAAEAALSEVEAAAERVVRSALHAARDVSSLTAEAAREARSSFTSFAAGVSSWWATLDSASEGGGGGDEDADAAARAEATLSLGLSPGEALLETFGCDLAQVYAARNGLTPERVVHFEGQLHVTTQRVLFRFEQRDGVPDEPLSLARIDVGAAERREAQAPLREACLAVRAAGTELLFVRFAKRGAQMDDALALLENLNAD